MLVSALRCCLQFERIGRRMGPDGDFVAPICGARQVRENDTPVVASLTSGRFTLTRPLEGMVRHAFAVCEMEKEASLLSALYSELDKLSTFYSWGNRCTSFRSAYDRVREAGLYPSSLVLPYKLLHLVCEGGLSESDADHLMLTRGCVTTVQSLKVVCAGDALADNVALLFADPKDAGFYFRSDDHVSVCLIKADRAVVVIHDLAR